MGQYHIVVNLDKQEFIHPHELGDGLKLREQVHSSAGICAAVCMLCAVSNGRGGGDFRNDYPEASEVLGRWGGDRIAWVGDYAEHSDLDEEHRAGTLFERCHSYSDDTITDGDAPLFTNISGIVGRALEREFGFTFTGTGWRNRDYHDNEHRSVAMAPDMIISL